MPVGKQMLPQGLEEAEGTETKSPLCLCAPVPRAWPAGPQVRRLATFPLLLLLLLLLAQASPPPFPPGPNKQPIVPPGAGTGSLQAGAHSFLGP